MFYTAFVHREGKHWLAEFPDAPGCQTFAGNLAALPKAATEALEGWLEAHLVDGQAPPRPKIRRRTPVRKKLLNVRVQASLAAAIHLRWARHDAGLSQRELAKLVGVSQQQIAKLENPDENPSLKTLEKVSKVLGLEVELSFSPIAA